MNRFPLRTVAALFGAAIAAAAFATPAAATAPDLTETSGPAALAAAQTSLRASLGAGFAGSWLDPATGVFVVGITDATRADQVRAGGGVPKVVRHSAAELTDIQSTLDRRAADTATAVPASVTGWYVDVPRNEVVVDVLDNDAAGLAWVAAAGASSLRVRPVAQAPRPLWAVIGGQALYFAKGRCSVGFTAHDAHDDLFVITAGHCTNLGGTVKGTGGTIGKVAKSSFPGNDYGTVKVTEDDVSTPPRVDRYGAGSDVRIDGSAVVGVGGRVCRSGSTTGWHCGHVEATGQTANYGHGNIVYGLTRTDVCAEPGDSGGSFVSRPSSGSGTKHVTAQGMLSGGSGNCSDGGATYFQPVREVLDRYDLTLESD
ncbi:S1 family peptidase [Amycolatopsis sp. NPDC058986]|uniref:S1 family peptidase n=1 Tax=unclassified Amycolatopsis TaxID=2618356 RepID=UPI0036707A71